LDRLDLEKQEAAEKDLDSKCIRCEEPLPTTELSERGLCQKCENRSKHNLDMIEKGGVS
jgi:hypothetical protein